MLQIAVPVCSRLCIVLHRVIAKFAKVQCTSVRLIILHEQTSSLAIAINLITTSLNQISSFILLANVYEIRANNRERYQYRPLLLFGFGVELLLHLDLVGFPHTEQMYPKKRDIRNNNLLFLF